MNRRNVVAGFGTTAVATGAVFGSGAFTSVEADRSLSFSLVGDTSGYLTFENVDGNYVTSSGTGAQGKTVVKVSASSLNDSAKTTLGQVDLTNNTADGSNKWVHVKNSGKVDGTVVDVQASGAQDTTGDNTNNVSDGQSIVGSANNVQIASGSSNSLTVEIVIDTTSSGGDPSTVSTATFVANNQDQS